MANKSVFASTVGRLLPRPDSRNHEGAPAYAFRPQHALAQAAVTGCLSDTFYADAREQLGAITELCDTVEPAFIAQTAIYCRERGYMKDMPALLTAILTRVGPTEVEPVFRRVIDNGRMLRSFVQIMRSGAVGRKSLGSRPKRLVRDWLAGASDAQLIRASVGRTPSLADIIKMVHPKPATAAREALFGYLIGRACDPAKLPDVVRQFEAFKAGETRAVPAVPFQMLTALDLDRAAWTAIARQVGWQALRMNLNTFARHGVFDERTLVADVAARLRDPDEVRRARVFPYQLMMAYRAAGKSVPAEIRAALQDAMEIAIANVPRFAGTIAVCPDVSGSMHAPITGWRRGATSAVRCVDVAALIGAAVLRRSAGAVILPFDGAVHEALENPRDSVMTNAARLAALGGGGTDCSAPLRALNASGADVDTVIIVSDYESWIDAARGHDTGVMREWSRLKRRCPAAKLVCIDLQPYATTQALERPDILNVGGFSDAVFDIVAAFADGTLGPDHWIGQIEEIEI